jgi:hypothetical protein
MGRSSAGLRAIRLGGEPFEPAATRSLLTGSSPRPGKRVDLSFCGCQSMDG